MDVPKKISFCFAVSTLRDSCAIKPDKHFIQWIFKVTGTENGLYIKHDVTSQGSHVTIVSVSVPICL